MVALGPWSIGLFFTSFLLLLIGGLLWSNANKAPEGQSKQPTLTIGIVMVVVGVLTLLGSIATLFNAGTRARSALGRF